MIQTRHTADDGLTGLELLILLVVFTLAAAVLIMYLDSGDTAGWARTFPGGLVAESVYISGDHIQPVGNVYGFPAVSSTSGNRPVIILHEDPGRLGIVRVVVSLFIGDTGAVDMDRVRVLWFRETAYENLSRTRSSALICPNWTISGKYNMLPGRTADSDDWLEPGEQFEITLCPQEGILPYGTFTLTLIPDGVVLPVKIRRTVPFSIQPVMNLG